jgi:two-component system nitrogen regulation response regulator NtrX
MGGSGAALVVDRDAEVREIIRQALEERGLITLGASSAAEAMEHLRGSPVGLMFVDLEMPAAPLQALMTRATEHPSAPLLIGMSSSGSDAPALDRRHGALYDILRKPLREGLLRFRADRAIEQLALITEERRLREELKRKLGFHGLVGRSATMERLRDKLDELSGSDKCVWFTGEEGTGKELAARILHASSRRCGHPFAVIDCSATEELPALDREGAIYLDHPAALSSGMQHRLLRHLLSMPSPTPRILAGSLQQPLAEVKLGRLLPELHGLLAESSLHLPPLRERGDDISLLAHHFVTTIGEINRLPPLAISAEALVVLERYSWPGNVRELRDCMERAVILAVEGKIRPQDLPERMRREGSLDWMLDGSAGLSEREFREAKRAVVDSFETAYLADLMQRFGGNVTIASKHAGMLRSALQRLLRKHHLRSLDFRKKKRPRADSRQVKPVVE